MDTYFVNTTSSGGDGTTNETSGATAAYATLAAFIAAEAADITAIATSTVTINGHDFDNIAMQVVLDAGATRTDDTAYAAVAGFTTDATHRLLFRAADGTTIAGQATNDSRHKGVLGAGYRIKKAQANTGVLAVTNLDTIFVEFEVENTSASNGRGIRELHYQSGRVAAIYINMIGKANDEAGIEISRYSRFINCLGISATGRGLDWAQPPVETRVYNCGSVATSNAYSVVCDTNEWTSKNTWGTGGTTACWHPNIVLGDYNASTDATAPGANSQDNIVTTAATDFVDHGSADYSPQDGGKLDSNGTDLSADGDFAFNFDITGAARTASDWDIGPFAMASSASSSDVNLHGTGRGILRGIGRGIG